MKAIAKPIQKKPVVSQFEFPLPTHCGSWTSREADIGRGIENDPARLLREAQPADRPIPEAS